MGRMIQPARTHLLFLAVLAILIADCQHQPSLSLHYLPGIVAGTEHVLPSTPIAVAPTTGAMAVGKFKVGSIYNADGSLSRDLYVKDPGPIVTAATMRCLSDAGMKPSPLASDADATPAGTMLKLAINIESIAIAKRFTSQQTVHGQYFSMKAVVKLRFTLSTSSSPALFSTVTTGTEEEPPAPVGGEVFLPLETDPAESLSVALSRAIGALVLQQDFRRALSQ